MNITGVAIIRDEVMYTLPAPNRHGDVIVKMAMAGVPKPVTNGAIQGFVLENGEFIDRVEGLELAKENGQYKPKYERNQLYSEDLW